jgi:hypothetical protein
MTMPARPTGLRPKVPEAWASWQDCGPFPAPEDPYRHAWRRGRLTVLSTLAWARFRGEDKWQWMISISSGGNYAGDAEVSRALRDFGMVAADEDNHEPGAVRKFWLPCDWAPGDASTCECKETETTITEGNGLAWQTEAAEPAAVEAKRLEIEAMRRAARILG